MISLTGIVLTKNEEAVINDCLTSLMFCTEIIVIDSGSTDDTIALAEKKQAKIYNETSADFAAKRNLGLEKATSEWVLYLDADERISDALAQKIKLAVEREPQPYTYYTLLRKNYYYGNNPWPMIERMPRLFLRSKLKGWQGALHESPVVEGDMGKLTEYLIHYSHQDLQMMVEKTNLWSETEAKLRLTAKHPMMTWWRFPRVMLSAFFTSYLKQRGFLAGTAGLVESVYQAFSIFITYAKLWELQQRIEQTPPPPTKKPVV